MIILFTVIDALQRINPYRQAGIIHNLGLDNIIANIGTADVATLATNYVQGNYVNSVTYNGENIDIISVKGVNVTTENAFNTLAGIDLNGGGNMWVQRVFSFIDTWPPMIYANTPGQTYLIFGSNYAGEWSSRIRELLDEILDSGLPADQMILPLIAQSILDNSFNYWNNVYSTTNAWKTYITGAGATVNAINWRQVIQQDIKGALLGAVAGGINNPENVEGAILIGAATGGMAASAQNVVVQTGMIAAE